MQANQRGRQSLRHPTVRVRTSTINGGTSQPDTDSSLTAQARSRGTQQSPAEDGSAHSTVEVVAEELGPSLRVGDCHTKPGDQVELSRAYRLVSNAAVHQARGR
jgi:hypothetical protein